MECDGTIVQQVQCAIEPLADKIGQGAEYLWGVNLRQTYIEGVTGLSVGLFCLAVFVIAAFVGTKYIRKSVRSKAERNATYLNSDETLWMTVGVVSAFLTFPAVLVGIIHAVQGIQRVLNPGYFTIQRILESVTS